MAEEKVKSTTTEVKAPLDQVPPPPEVSMPVLKRKPTQLEPKVEKENPVWLQMPGGDVEICGMPPGQVFNNLELCERGCKEFARQSTELNRRMEQLRMALKHIDKTSQLLNHHQCRLRAMNPSNPNDAVKQFQARSLEQRTKRRENALAFMNKGTTVGDVKKAMQIASPLDQAHGRRGGFGQKRPQAGLLRTVK